MGWGDAFFEGYDRGLARKRQTRMDALNEEYTRGTMSLRQAAEARAAAMAQERSSTAAALRDRMGYLDRLRVLQRETDPLKALGVKFPGAGAAPDVNRAMTLDEELARNPAGADVRPPLVDPATGTMMGPYEPGSQPTPREQRATAISAATGAYGQEQDRLTKALEALKLRIAATQHPGANRPPKVTALDIQYRAVQRKKLLADQLENGVIWDKDGMVRQILTPEQLPAARAQAKTLRDQAAAEERLVAQGYRAAGVTPPALEDAGSPAPAPSAAPGPLGAAPGAARQSPEAAAASLQAQGLSADDIAAQLERMFSPEELQTFGQTQE